MAAPRQNPFFNQFGQQPRGGYPEPYLNSGTANASQVPLVGAGAYNDQQGPYDNHCKPNLLCFFLRSAPYQSRVHHIPSYSLVG
jgi:hypothetical protein